MSQNSTLHGATTVRGEPLNHPGSTIAEPAPKQEGGSLGAGGRITTVSYRRLKNLGNYENEVVETSAYVLINEDPADVVKQLRVWVCQQLEVSVQDVQRLQGQAGDLKGEIYALEDEADALRQRIEKMRTWAAEYGTKFMVDLDQALPF